VKTKNPKIRVLIIPKRMAAFILALLEISLVRIAFLSYISVAYFSWAKDTISLRDERVSSVNPPRA
jgi:hypothetical protein